MKTVKLVEPRRFELFDLPIPPFGPDQVLIKVRYCGVCATEIHFWLHAGDKNKIYGHEVVGDVVAVGSAVTQVKPGMRVTGMIYEGFAEYTVADAAKLVIIPDAVDDLSAFGEPLSCLISAVDRMPIQLGDHVAIVGAGYMGLGLLKFIKIKGAGKITVIDIRDESLDLARRLGADEVFHPDQVPERYKVEHWNDRMYLDGIPVVAEVTGTEPGLDLAGRMVSLHGHLNIVGYHGSNGGIRQVHMDLWNWKALNICNGHERRDAVHLAAQRGAMALLANGKLTTRELITHVYHLDQINQAFAAQIEKPSGFIKAVIAFDA